MPSLSQVALSATSLEDSLAWYERVLGMRRSGSTRLFRGPLMERITGIPDPVSRCAWMVDRQHRFQLEIFEFERPLPRRRVGRSRRDIGYSAMTVCVDDLDGVLDAAGAAAGPILGPLGSRRADVCDPDGNELIVTEADPREPGRRRPRVEGVSAVRAIRASVPDLERSLHFFERVIGLRGADRDALGDESDDRVDRAALWAGDVLVELVSHPDATPWPEGYRLSDVGFLNVAFTTATRREHRTLCRRVSRAGYRLLSRPARFGLGGVVYATDQQGFSVELVHLTPIAARWLGYLA